MKSVYRFLYDHSGLCRVLLFGLLFSVTVYLSGFSHISFLSIYLLDLLIWFFVGRFIALAPAKLLEDPLRIMDQECDPHPFLEECTRQLERSKPSPQQQLAQINRATALRMLGENFQVLEILENLNIARFPSTTPFIKYVYYNNLVDVLFELDRDVEAHIWHKKAMQLYQDLPVPQAEKFYGQSMNLTKALALYHQGEFEDALKIVTWMKCETPRHLMDAALLAARCHIALEEPEKAREKLQYVVDHGNKLHIVQEAKEIIEKLD